MYIACPNKGFSGRAMIMKRLLAVLVLGFLALAGVGLAAGTARAGAAACAPHAASILDDVADMADPAAYAESPAARGRSTLAEGTQLACNSACARACAQRFGRCPTRECRQQFSACVRGCGC